MDDKYIPVLQERKSTVMEQIAEARRIYYRTELEKREHVLRGASDQVAADDFNNKNMAKKIDLLFEILEELNNEDSSNTAQPGTIVQPDAGGTPTGAQTVPS